MSEAFVLLSGISDSFVMTSDQGYTNDSLSFLRFLHQDKVNCSSLCCRMFSALRFESKQS